jgi:hypothetical protein
VLGLDTLSIARSREDHGKVAASTATPHELFDESHRAICLREHFLSTSYGEGLETGQTSGAAPRQSSIRQLFFKWIKQRLRVKAFFGTSKKAVKTHIWIAVAVYVLVAIVKQPLKLPLTLYETPQFLSHTLFEQMLTDQPPSRAVPDPSPTETHNQMNVLK